MRFNRTRMLIALVLIFQISFAGFCGKNETKAKTLARAADDFAQAQISAVNLIKSARDTNLIQDEDVAVLKAILSDINGFNQQAIDLAKGMLNQDPIPLEKQEQLLKVVYQISNAITRLNNAGLLRIKNSEKQAAFSAIVTALQAAATTAITVLVKKG